MQDSSTCQSGTKYRVLSILGPRVWPCLPGTLSGRHNSCGWEKVKKSDEIENSLKAESTLKRVDSLKNLGEKSLVKNVARTNLQDEDSESDVAKQIRNISP